MTPPPVDVLIAEDNPSDAELVLESLRAANIRDRIHVVHDGVEALDFLFRRAAYAGLVADRLPRVVFLDIKLPKVDGFEVLRALKADALTCSVPVVMLTSSNVERDVAQCYALGVNSYVQKPVDFGQFRDIVGQIGRYWLQVNVAPPRSAERRDGL